MKNVRGFGFFVPLVAVVVLFSVTVICQQPVTSARQETSSQAESQAAPAGENAGTSSSSQDSSGTNFLGAYDLPAPPQDQPPVPGAAPVLGHPLDPADVDTLTGKNDQRRQVGPIGGGYYGYPMTNDMFGTPQFGTRFWGTPGSRFWSPFMFGGFGRGFGGRGFRTFGSNGVFFAPPAGTSFFLGGPHFATPGMFTPGRNWNFGVPPQANVTGSPFGPRHQP